VKNPLEPVVAFADRLQRRTTPTAFVVGVVKRYGDDRGGTLAAIVTFYGFLSVFPLLLLFFTVMAKNFLHLSPAHQARVIEAVLSQFPYFGKDLEQQIHTLSRNSTVIFVITFLGLLWGALGIANALQHATNTAWRVPRHQEPALLPRVARSLALLGVLALVMLAGSVLTGLSAAGIAAWGSGSWWLRTLTLVGGAAVNIGGYLLAFWVLTPSRRDLRVLLPGAVVGGLGWSALQYLGTSLLQHHLTRAGALYGVFAVVLGLVFWINLGAQLFLYATEVNVVADQHLWPRGLTEPAPEIAAALRSAEDPPA